jgi:hypothetical protein
LSYLCYLCLLAHSGVQHILCSVFVFVLHRFVYNLVTDQSRDILADLGFIADGNYNSLLQTYIRKCRQKFNAIPHDIVTGPCCYYNYKGCVLGELHCPFTHICKDWFHGSCLNENCEWSHNILNKQTKRLLQTRQHDPCLGYILYKVQQRTLCSSCLKLNDLQ